MEIFLDISFWILFSLTAGIAEGGMFAEGNTSHSFNVHTYLQPLRVVVAAMSLHLHISLFPSPTLWTALALILTQILTFSFFHNGAYYETRRKIDVPHYHWAYQSEETTAFFSFGFVSRTLQAIIGLALYAIIHFI